MEQRDRRIMIKHDFWLGHSEAATVANVNKALGAGTASEHTVLRLFTKFRCGEMESDHKSGTGRPGRCNVDHLGQKVKVRPISIVRQRGSKLLVAPLTISRHLAAIRMVKSSKHVYH
ncbi:hypothetical protein TNIN_444241 [Trichonephila inaurata madagascariensis]|uniref:Mos1 transposase HTH domain-containing protein n=1 Tax=Trichonephila inaurata madagascariensis TaxID=2747483 RepID=A0A8X6ILQ3_9ARAC|nr:hypothetical protein TNIN_444241 [Trichonephila inaurata madagascariensis]